MKEIHVIAEYPEENEEEIFNMLAIALGYKDTDGDKKQFVASKCTAHFDDWLRASYHVGYRIANQIPHPDPRINPEGFGDTVAVFIEDWITRPIKRVFTWLSMNCGCDGRRKWLNKHFPYKQKQLS